MPTTFRPANVLFAVTALLLMAMLVRLPPPRSASAATAPAQIRDTVVDMSDNLPGKPTDFETFYISGDKPMPQGATSTTILNKGQIGAVWCNYRFPHIDRQIGVQIDVYQYVPGGPLLLLMICPHCTARGHVGKDKDHGINVRQEVKAMTFEPPTPQQRMTVFPGWTAAAMLREYPNGLGGILSVEPFGCTWDVRPEHQQMVGGKVCDFHVVLDKNVLRRVPRPSK